MKKLFNLQNIFLIGAVILILVGNHLFINRDNIFESNDVGTSITTINATDKISDSRTTINNNFTALNNGKLEKSNYFSTTTFPATLDTDALTEGSTNLYFTNGRVYSIVGATTSLPNLTDIGTITALDFTNASGTGITADDIWASTSTIDYLKIGNNPQRPLVSTMERTITVGSGKDYETIQEAINQVPTFLYHDYDINVDDGTYDEDLTIYPIVRATNDSEHPNDVVNLTITGNTSTSSDVKVKSLYMLCPEGQSSVTVQGFEFSTSTPIGNNDFAVEITGGGGANLSYISFAEGVAYGIIAYNSSAILSHINIDNTDYGFGAKQNGHLDVRSATGTASDYAYRSSIGSSIIVRESLAEAGISQFYVYRGGSIYDDVHEIRYFDGSINIDGGLTADGNLLNTGTITSGGNITISKGTPKLIISDTSYGGLGRGEIAFQNSFGENTARLHAYSNGNFYYTVATSGADHIFEDEDGTDIFVLTKDLITSNDQLKIDQNGNATSLNIDSEATSATVLSVTAENTSGNIVNIDDKFTIDYAGNLTFTNASSTGITATNIWATTFTGALTGTASGNLTSADIDTLAELNALMGETIASTTANLSVFTNDAGFITASTTQLTLTGNSWIGGNVSIDGNLTVLATTTLSGVAYNWPDADGDATNVLTTDGNGQLSWAAAGSGDGWEFSSSTLEYWIEHTSSLIIANATIQSGDISAGLTWADVNSSPDDVGEVFYDNTITGLADGGFSWYDDDAVRYFVDVTSFGDDDYVVAYDADADGWYMKEDLDTDTTLDLSGAETITGNWVNTSNPWADDEVSDTLTCSDLTATTNDTLVTAHALERHFVINVATTSVDYKGTNFTAGATSTIKMTAPEAMTITWLGGDVQTSGVCGIRMSDGSNFTPYQAITTTAATSSPASNNTFTALENWQFEINLSTDDTVCTIIGEYNTD